MFNVSFHHCLYRREVFHPVQRKRSPDFRHGRQQLRGRPRLPCVLLGR